LLIFFCISIFFVDLILSVFRFHLICWFHYVFFNVLFYAQILIEQLEARPKFTCLSIFMRLYIHIVKLVQNLKMSFLQRVSYTYTACVWAEDNNIVLTTIDDLLSFGLSIWILLSSYSNSPI
jgi:hypothetical protein